MRANTEKLFYKHASIKVKGFTVCMTLTDFEQATAELLTRLQLKSSRHSGKVQNQTANRFRANRNDRKKK